MDKQYDSTFKDNTIVLSIMKDSEIQQRVFMKRLTGNQILIIVWMLNEYLNEASPSNEDYDDVIVLRDYLNKY